MNERIRLISIVAIAFVAGLTAGRVPRIANATPVPVIAAATDVLALPADAYPSPNPNLPGVRTKPLVVTDAMTVSAQIITDAPKHTHAISAEYQVVLAGTGSEWLGDTRIALRPGTFVAVPPGTVHAGVSGGPLTLLTIKAPPQQPLDVHPAP